MKTNKIFQEVEMICRKERIMEKHYGFDILTADKDTDYFTTSQEMDIMEMIEEGLQVKEIIQIIKKW